MSGTITLTPYLTASTPVQQRGSWIASAGNLATAVNDASDSTYDRLNADYTSYSQGASIWYRLGNASGSLPAGARITKIYPRARAARVGGVVRYMKLAIAESSKNPGILSSSLAIGVDDLHAPTITVGSNVANYYGPGGSKTWYGDPLTQAQLNQLWLQVFYVSRTDTRIYEVAGLVDYDEKPTATISYPTGTVSDAGSPTITWDYLDDLQPQVAYQVQLYDGGGNLDYDSGTVSSSDEFHVVKANLPDDTYTIKLRVAQKWTLPGGTFWSDWISQSFTLAVERISIPTLTVTPQSAGGYIDVSVQHNLNMVNYDLASNELGTAAMWTLTNFNFPFRDSGQKRTGTYSSLFTVNGSPAASAANVVSTITIPTGPNQTISMSGYWRAVAGSTTANVIPRIEFFDAASVSLGTTTGAGVSISSAGFTAVPLQATSPANAVRCTIKFIFGTALTSGHGYYLDDLMVRYGTSATMPTTNRKGGVFDTSVNKLTTGQSTFENVLTEDFEWLADNANTTVDMSTTFAFNGTTSMRMTRNGSTGTAQVRIKDFGPYYPVNPGDSFSGYFAARSATSRTLTYQVNFWDKDLGALTPVSGTLVTSTSAWLSKLVTGTVPANAAYASIQISAASVVVGEFHYMDFIYFGTGFLTLIEAGRRNIDGPISVVQYSEDAGVTWNDLGTYTLDPLSGVVSVRDYTVKTGQARRYRAYNAYVESGRAYQSDYSSVSSDQTVTLTNVWMHSDADPNGTAYNFVYDGSGRTDQPDAMPILTKFAGRTYAQIDFGEDRERDISVTLQLPDSTSQARMMALAKVKSTVVFRDQRGRRVRGAISQVSFTDEIWGQTVSFTVRVGGEQWDVD